MVRLAGLEPVTPTMSRWCSNQLSYSRVDRADDKQFLRGKQDLFFLGQLDDKKLSKIDAKKIGKSF